MTAPTARLRFRLLPKFAMPGTPPARPVGTLDSAFCVACGVVTHASVHAWAPLANAEAIEGATRVGAMLNIDVARSALGAWYGLVPQAATLEDFMREDRHGGFWTPQGVVCRACSGMPGVGDDWRAGAWVARCFCGWVRSVPYARAFAKERAAERARHVPFDPTKPFPGWVETDQDAWGRAERAAERSLRGHAAAKHRERAART